MADQDYATVSGTRVHRSDFAYAPEGSKPSEWKLPIHDAAHVRNALARFSQTDLPPAAKAGVWRKIRAAAKKFGIEVSGKSSELISSKFGVTNIKTANSELRTGQLRTEQLRTLNSEVRNGLVRIAVAYTGEFVRDGRKFSITARDLEEMRRNLEQREAPIDYEHLSAAGQAPPGWARAAGWIRRPAGVEGLGTRGSGLGQRGKSPAPSPQPLVLWAWAELTPACLAMIKQKEYRYFSPEIHWHETDEQGRKIGTRLAAGAMTNRPFLKDLPPIEISDADYNGLFGLAPDVGPRLRGDDGGGDSRGGRIVGSARHDGGHSRAGGNPPLLAMVGLSETGKLMDLDSVHVPAASKQISVAYHQTGEESGKAHAPGSRKPDSPLATDHLPLRKKETAMANKFSFRKLTEGPHAGRFGLYKHDDLMMDEGEPVVFDEEDFPQTATNDGDGEDAAATRGDRETLPVSGQAPLAATEAQLLAEAFHEGRVDLARASALADSGRIALGAVFRAQAAEKIVDQFIAEGRLLPKRRAAAFRLALEDEAGLRALLADSRPLVDFGSRGLAGAAHLVGSAQSELDEMVRQWIAEHNTDYSAALTEVTKRNPELWQRASAEVSERTRSGEDED